MARFDNVSCSQCGQDFGPGDEGYSYCSVHRAQAAAARKAKEAAAAQARSSDGPR